MTDYNEIFHQTVGHSYLNTFEKLIEISNLQKLTLNPLQNKLHSRLQNYYNRINESWLNDTKMPASLNEPQFKEYAEEAYHYLVTQLKKYPIVFILWEMDETVYTSFLRYQRNGY